MPETCLSFFKHKISRKRALYLIWGRAGIQSVGDNNNFKNLDSRSPLTTGGDKLREE